MFLRYYSEVFY